MDTEELVTIENRILEAAKLVFVRKGYEATKMSEIAAEAGIGRTALHYYFRTKDMLFDAIFDQLMGALLPNVGVIMDGEGTILEKLPKIITQYVLTLRRNPLFPIFVVNELHRDPEHLYRSIMKDPTRVQPIIHLQAQITEEMEKGMLKKMSLLYSASTLISLLVFPMLVRSPLATIFLHGDFEKFDAFLEERVPFVIDIVVRMLTPDNEVQDK